MSTSTVANGTVIFYPTHLGLFLVVSGSLSNEELRGCGQFMLQLLHFILLFPFSVLKLWDMERREEMYKGGEREGRRERREEREKGGERREYMRRILSLAQFLSE